MEYLEGNWVDNLLILSRTNWLVDLYCCRIVFVSKNKLSHDLKWSYFPSDVFGNGIRLVMIVAEVFNVEVEDFAIELDGLGLTLFVVDFEDNVLCFLHLNYSKLINYDCIIIKS